jgi:hypothetical protein
VRAFKLSLLQQVPLGDLGVSSKQMTFSTAPGKISEVKIEKFRYYKMRLI